MMQEITAEEMKNRISIVTHEYEGILPMNYLFYQRSIRYTIKRAIKSFEKYENINCKEQPDEAFGCIQEAVTHAAAASRFFWPSISGNKIMKDLKKARGEKLREMFGLDESSVLYNRDLRNASEHFDERLDSYLLGLEAGMICPDVIVQDHSITDDPVGHIFKLLDPVNECIVFFGVKHYFAPLRDEVKRISELNMQMLH